MRAAIPEAPFTSTITATQIYYSEIPRCPRARPCFISGLPGLLGKEDDNGLWLADLGMASLGRPPRPLSRCGQVSK